MKMLIIGGTSFKGSKMTMELIDLGYEIDLLVESEKDVFFGGYKNIVVCDRSDEFNLKNVVLERKYDYIVDIDNHMKKDVMNLLNSSNKENLGQYMLCSSGNI